MRVVKLSCVKVGNSKEETLRDRLSNCAVLSLK